MRVTIRAALALLLLALPTSVFATPGALSPVKRTLSVRTAVPRTCHSSLRAPGRGVALTAYRAPMSGFVDVRGAASDRSDWDLVVFDAASRRVLASSESFGSHEVAQSWVGAGQRLAIQGCRRTGKAKRFALTIHFLDLVPPKASGTPMLVRVPISGPQDVVRMDQLGLDVTEDVQRGRAIVHLDDAGQTRLLTQNGFKYTVVDANMSKSDAAARQADFRYAAGTGSSPLPSGRTEYRHYGDYQTELKALADGHPGLIRPVTLPEKTFQGRPIQGIEIAKNVNATGDGRPVYFVMGEHHAREWPSAEIAMEWATYLAHGYGTNKQITSLLSSERVVIVPIINADGFISSRESFDLGDQMGYDPNVTLVEAVGGTGGNFAYRRKNCDGAVPSPDFPCELQWGVDPNRNYGEGWGGPGASSSQNTQTYRGTGPWSEPETQAVHEYSQHHQITALVTLHNFASLVLRPPGLARDGKAPDEERMKQLGDEMADDTGYTSEFGWQLYDTSGTTEDWNYAAAGTYGYTIELGPASDDGGNFHIEYQRAVVDQWTGTPGTPQAGKGMRQALTTLALAAANPADHSVIAGKAPAGDVLRLHKSFQTSSAPVCAVADPAVAVSGCFNEGDRQLIEDQLDTTLVVPKGGHYDWNVGPSSRPFVLERRFPDPGTKVKTETQTGQAPLPNDHNDHSFDVTDPSVNQLRIALDWPLPDDMDMVVYRKQADGSLKQVGSSGGPAGSKEFTIVENVTPGTYVVRVVNFSAVPGETYTITFDEYNVGADIITPGHTEAYTMTLEKPDGTVLDTRDVTVLRGQQVSEDFR